MGSLGKRKRGGDGGHFFFLREGAAGFGHQGGFEKATETTDETCGEKTLVFIFGRRSNPEERNNGRGRKRQMPKWPESVG